MTEENPSRPVLGVGAVIVHEGRVALIKRANEPFRGVWSIPGGRVEWGEDSREAAVREAREETGLTVEASELLEVFESVVSDQTNKVVYHHVVLDYFCLVKAGELRAGEDASEARWAKLEELAGLKVSEGATRIIRKAFALAAKK